MADRDAFASAVRQRNVSGVLRLLFDRGTTSLRYGYHSETELWEFKSDCPRVGKEHENAWAELAADVLAFHNNLGGVILFGITDGDFRFRGATSTLDSKKVNDRLRRYLPDTIWVEYYREFIQEDQRYLGVALIPPRGPVPARFRSSAPLVGTKRRFEKNGSARRDGDSTRVLSPSDAEKWIHGLAIPVVTGTYALDVPNFRLLAPDYSDFIRRSALCDEVEQALRDERTAVASLVGVGGMGKTSLATWAVAQAYDRDQFDFIVSMTAKDRELTATGIVGLEAGLSSFESLLDAVADVLGFADLKAMPLSEREAGVRLLLESGKGLLYVDNLETVDDARIIQFLDSLPVGTRAVVTSRRTRVRVSIRPIDVGPMSEQEVIEFIDSLQREERFRHLASLTAAEEARIGSAWDGIPLAIRWALSRSRTGAEAIASAEQAAALGSHGDELLEFSFRRVFESLNETERLTLHVLATLQAPIPIEAIVAASGASEIYIIDAVDDLVNDALVQRVFDEDRNDYCYTVIALTQSFVRRELQREPNVAKRIQRSLTEWFDARDIRDVDQRLVVRELRQGARADDTALVDLATSAEKRGDLDHAEKLYGQALARSPRGWRAARLAAEFYRHKRNNQLEALRLYSIAVANSPARGSDRALIYREFGLLLKDSGEPNAAERAEEALSTAVAETPHDEVALGVLASLLDARHASSKLIVVVEPHMARASRKFISLAGPLLLRAYERTTELTKAAVLRSKLDGTSGLR